MTTLCFCGEEAGGPIMPLWPEKWELSGTRVVASGHAHAPGEHSGRLGVCLGCKKVYLIEDDDRG